MQQQDKLHQRLAAILCKPEERMFKAQHLTPENTEIIRSLKNKYKDKRCFIVGSSPSLNLLDLTKLNNEFTFTVNRGYLLKDKGLLHSTYHIISDNNTFQDTDSKWQEMTNFSEYLFCYAGMQAPNVQPSPIYFDYITHRLANAPCQTNLEQALTAYESVVHFAIQIAAYLGFTTIYLLGVDLDFAVTKGHSYQETAEEAQRQLSHSVQAAQTMLQGIDKCAKALESNGIQMYNASPKGVVDCIPRVKYEELF